MFGVTPEIFDKFEAADLASKAFQLEENVPWTVVRITINNSKFYRPCRVDDYNYDVKADGWVIADD